MNNNELIGKINKFNVLRETQIGYLLQKDGVEYFLHKNEAEKRYLKNGEVVDAFLYFDNEKRLAATLRKPIIQDGECSLLKVKAVNYPLGIFLENNISKDLLMSSDNLIKNKSLWPIEGDFILARLKAGSKQLKAVLQKEDLKKPEGLKLNDTFTGYVCLYTGDNMYIVNEKLEYVKVMSGNYLKKERLGMKVCAKIIYIGFNDILGDLSENKEEWIKYKKIDVFRFIKKVKQINLSYYTKEIIKEELDISNKLFKKILLILKHDNLVDIKNNQIVIKGDINGK